MRTLCLSLGAFLAAAPLAAQSDCTPSSSSREADVFAHLSVPLAYSIGQSPWIYRPGSVHLGVEGALLPDASSRMRTPTKCRPTAGPENWNVGSYLIRPRVGFALGDGVLLEASWLPPVRIGDIKPNLWSFALSRTVPMNTKGAMFSGRLHTTLGSVRAPITCSAAAILAAGPCFNGTRSNDRFSPNIFGVELAVAWPLAQGRLRPYFGGGYNILHPRFQVSYTDSLGQRNDQKTRVNLSRWTVFGGATLEPVPGFMLSAEAYSAPSDLITARVRMNVMFGGREGRRR
jgi:hypothetical protein